MSTHSALVSTASAPADAPLTRTDAHEVLTFRLGKEEYGIDLLCVQEIRSYQEPTRLSGAPASMLGVIELRGEILPIMDLRHHFGMSSASFDALTVVIVVNLAERSVGVVVDSVNDVVRLEPGQVRGMPPLAGLTEPRHIAGIASLPERTVILLDITRLLGHPALGLSQAEALLQPA